MVTEIGPSRNAKILYLRTEFNRDQVEERVEELVPMTEEDFQQLLNGIKKVSSLSELGNIRSIHDDFED